MVDAITRIDDAFAGLTPAATTTTTANADDAGSTTPAAQPTPVTSSSNSIQLSTSTQKSQARDNPLHDLANWTYQIAVYMMHPGEYNTAVQSGSWSSPPAGSIKLWQSGGFTKDASRTFFDKDYYIDSFRFNSAVGINQVTRNANMYDMEMIVSEPFGADLISELLETAHNNGIADHLNTPYLVEIKFHGYNDQGKLVTSAPGVNTKYIPVRFTQIKFKLTAGATKWVIAMNPYPSEALSPFMRQGYLQTNVKPEGTTFKELLDHLTATINSYQKDLVNQGLASQSDTYSIKVVNNPALEQAQLTFDTAQGPATNQATRKLTDVSSTNQTYGLTAGSAIKEVLMRLAHATRYYKDQVQQEPDKTKAAELFKVVPYVTIGEWDTKRHVYQKDFTYKIITYKMYGQQHPGANQGPATLRPQVKNYYWLFTGKNKDVLNLDIDYDLQWFTQMTPTVDSKARALMGTPANSTLPTITDVPSRTAPGNNSFIPPVLPTEGVSDTIALRRDGKASVSGDYMDGILNGNTGGDMASLRMEIIGDPDWIPQDRSILPNGDNENPSFSSGFVDDSPEKGIATDADAIHAQILFRTPRDYNDQTGLMDLTDQDYISGLYQIWQVDSKFDNGKFTQILNGVRLPAQKRNDPSYALDDDQTLNPNSTAVANYELKNIITDDIATVQNTTGATGTVTV
jgi:hypothetical protein